MCVLCVLMPFPLCFPARVDKRRLIRLISRSSQRSRVTRTAPIHGQCMRLCSQQSPPVAARGRCFTSQPPVQPAHSRRERTVSLPDYRPCRTSAPPRRTTFSS